jgi:hypothetical protein
MESNEGEVQPADQAAGRAMQVVVQNGVAFEVPKSWPVLKGACDTGGLDVPAVVVTDSALKPCLGSHAGGATRVYVLTLDVPPFNEPWEEVTTVDGYSNGEEIRVITSGSVVGTNTTPASGKTIPSRNLAVIVTGPVLADIASILESVTIRAE